MNCSFEACHRPLTKADMRRRIEYRQAPAGAKVKYFVFGEGMPDGNIDEATGPLAMTFHHKCHFAYQRRQQLIAAKAADPPAQQPVTDWREQETADVEELVGEGNGGNRGA